MIDVYTPTGLIPAASRRALAEQLTAALLRAEGQAVVEPFASNTAAYLHELPAAAVHTAATDRAQVARIEVLTPPGVLSREGQRQLVADATRIVAEVAGDPSLAGRTWVLLTEAAEGGWGIAGTAFGRQEFSALAGAATTA